jgi:hypothetical protein
MCNLGYNIGTHNSDLWLGISQSSNNNFSYSCFTLSFFFFFWFFLIKMDEKNKRGVSCYLRRCFRPNKLLIIFQWPMGCNITLECQSCQVRNG